MAPACMAFEVCQERTVCLFVCITLCAYPLQQTCSSFFMQFFFIQPCQSQGQPCWMHTVCAASGTLFVGMPNLLFGIFYENAQNELLWCKLMCHQLCNAVQAKCFGKFSCPSPQNLQPTRSTKNPRGNSWNP